MSVVESYDRDVNGGTIENPVPVAPRHKDVACILDSFEHGAVVTPANALRGQKTRAGLGVFLDLAAGDFKPVAAEVRGLRKIESCVHRVHILIR